MPDKVFLAIPTYDDWLSVHAMHGVISGSKRFNIQLETRGSSALPFVFNQLWCRGVLSDCDYFAMLHADVGPDSGWLDTLIDELEEHNADMMSCVIPIKDLSGKYSVALAHSGCSAHYRLGQEHYPELPATFDGDDLRQVTGEKGILCANTGAWVCRLHEDWNRKVDFRFVTSIDWSNARPHCDFIPEDWLFSQMLDELGKRVMCTKKVRCVHSGRHLWAPQPMEEMQPSGTLS